MKREIKHKWFFNQPPREVWEYLTDPRLIEQWLMKNDFRPVVGHSFQFTLRAMPDLGLDGTIYCKVLEIVPHKKLSYSWKSGPGNGKITVDSVVVWTLLPKDNGTELLLEHSGFMENTTLFSMMHEGWLKNIKKIDQLLNPA